MTMDPVRDAQNHAGAAARSAGGLTGISPSKLGRGRLAGGLLGGTAGGVEYCWR